MPIDIKAAVELANYDDDVHVIVLQGKGRAFCAGYDLVEFAENTEGATQSMKRPWDPVTDYYLMGRNTNNFASLWYSLKPTIAKVRGFAVAGGEVQVCFWFYVFFMPSIRGSLSCDIVVMADDAKIGYPPARVWGIPTTMMWITRVGAEWAKRMLFTGQLISGKKAESIGLISECCSESELDQRVEDLAMHIAAVPKNQLAMSKLVVNNAVDLQGLPQSQMLATLFDGIARHSPEGVAFKKRSEKVGFKRAVQERDSGQPIFPEVSKKFHRFEDSDPSRQSKL
eukprot:CAMPEP_0184006164 /NCGR_PEP_ID=MMETSP0954-20121128/507_1 /TAXON_ID=627963 /ORGANISM="Aplanochytrium sp, Strain PBS07" /LENGTH=282 /DNA_ID=CAMNT_0026284615 /DNA_START=181 /DNA_END=1030 /DNA_ORIENTATION=+